MLKTLLFNLLGIILVTAMTTSCGKRPQFISNIALSTYEENGDSFVRMDTTINSQKLTLPNIQLPIFNPVTGENLGSFSLSSNQHLIINLDLTMLTKLQEGKVTLPNGMVVPLINDKEAYSIPIGGNVANLYVYLAQDVLALGVSVNIANFDQIGRRIGTAGFFPIFRVKDISGSAGLYFSQSPGKNGLGVFADLSSLLTQMPHSAYVPAGSMELDFIEVIMTENQQQVMDQEITRMNNKRVKLKVK